MASVLFSAAVLAQNTPNSQHQPAFFWGTQQFSPPLKQHESLREVTSADLERTVEKISSTQGPSSQGTALFDGRPDKPPEVQLVFLAEGLSTDGVRAHGNHLPLLQAMMERSASSATVPFTLPSPQMRAFAHVGPHVTGSEVEAYLKERSGIFTNGVTDVVVVELAATDGNIENVLGAHDTAINRITRTVHDGTNGNYAALLTGAHGARGGHRMLTPVSPTVAYLHTGPTLLTAQLVGLILIVIFLSGLCCLFSLQTPKKFEEVKHA